MIIWSSMYGGGWVTKSLWNMRHSLQHVRRLQSPSSNQNLQTQFRQPMPVERVKLLGSLDIYYVILYAANCSKSETKLFCLKRLFVFFVTICRIVRQLEFHPINSFSFIQFRLSCFIGVMMNSNVAWWSLGRLKLCSLCRFKLPGFLQSCGRLRCEPSQ